MADLAVVVQGAGITKPGPASAALVLLRELTRDVAFLPVRAYMMATVQHECAGTFLPISEFGQLDYFRRYETPWMRQALGNTEPGDGYRFRGRGFVQITGRGNYRLSYRKLLAKGLMCPDLEKEPDAALRFDVAYQIMLHGMDEGWFTGRRIGTFLSPATVDVRAAFVEARRVINGLDKAVLIGSYAERWLEAMR